jgi:multicomponent Na+:H+ antiporter subunit E
MTTFLLNILLALAWVALTGQFTAGNLAIGFILGYLVLMLTRWDKDRPVYFRKFWLVIRFAAFFLYELLLANLRMAYMVLKPRYDMRPGVVAVPLDLTTDLQITLLANLLTLTPGTLALDVADDRSELFVHTAHVEDVEAFRAEVKNGFERRIKELFA